MKLANLFLAIFLITFTFAQAGSFLRLEGDHAKAKFSDDDGDGVDDERELYTFVPELNSWIISENSFFDPSNNSWNLDFKEEVQKDPTTGQFIKSKFLSYSTLPEICIVYEFDSQGRVAKEFITSPPDPCEITYSTFVISYAYDGSSDRIENKSEYSSIGPGSFDWAKPEKFSKFTYSSTGKVILEIMGDSSSSDESIIKYSYDSNDNLFSTEFTYTLYPNEVFITNYSYDHHDDLVEETNVKIENGVLAAYENIKRMSYDPVLRTVKAEEFLDLTQKVPYQTTTQTYDLDGHLIQEEIDAGGSVSRTRYQY